MKKIICFLLAFLIVAPALADEVEDFNLYSTIFGGKELENGSVKESENGTFTEYYLDDCQIIFRNVDGKLRTIYITGNGEPFLTYCAAALMACDSDSANASTNFGNLLLLYFFAKGSEDTEPHVGYTVAGQSFGVNRENETTFRFMVIK